MEEAAIILRVTRAPERLLFNVSTGKLDQNRADEMVREFTRSLMTILIVSRKRRSTILACYNFQSIPLVTEVHLIQDAIL